MTFIYFTKSQITEK